VPSLALHQDVAYRIDLTALYTCVSNRNLFTEPMPTNADIPVTQVLWANESTGIDGDLWIDVHDQRMVPAATVSAAAGDKGPLTSPKSSAKGLTVREIRDTLARQCAATAGCRERAATLAAGQQQTLELPIGQQPSRPALMRTIEPPVTTDAPQQH
jgi:hypothetical protein